MYIFSKNVQIMINIVLLIAIFIQPVLTEEIMDNTLKITVDTIMRLANADKDASELIQNIYPEPERGIIMQYKLSQVMEKMPPECVRLSNKGVYFIYKFKHENYLFVFYKSLEVDNFPLIWYLGKKLYLEDFEKLSDEKASLEYVQSFDQYGDYTSFYMGIVFPTSFSFHYTVDGYLVRLDYISEIGKRAEICKITMLSNEDNPLYYNLLPIDKKLINR